MCTHQVVTLPVQGAAKGPTGWFRPTEAVLGVDHPVHATATHTVNVDLRRADGAAAQRVALELEPASARALAQALLAALDALPPGLVEA